MTNSLHAKVSAVNDWTEAEKWVWEKVCNGELADFNEKLGKALDPRSPEGWTRERLISPSFLETVLLYEPYKSALPRRGFRIVGAWFDQDIDLSNASIDVEWWLDDSRLDCAVDLTSLHSSNFVSFEKSFIAKDLQLKSSKIEKGLNTRGIKIIGLLNMNSIVIGENLYMGSGSEYSDISLTYAAIHGQLDLSDTKVMGNLDMNSISIDGPLFFHNYNEEGKSEFTDIDVSYANIGGSLNFFDSSASGTLNMNSISVEGPLFITSSTNSQKIPVFKSIDLANAKLRDQVTLAGARVEDLLDMNSIKIDSHLIMNEAVIKDVVLSSASISGQFDLSGVKISGFLDMSSISVKGSLNMSSMQGKISEFKTIYISSSKIGGILNLRGVKVSETLDMNSISVQDHLYMGYSSEFKEIILSSASISGQLSLSGAKVSGTLDMNSITIGSALFMTSTTGTDNIEEKNTCRFRLVQLGSSTIEGELDIMEAEFEELLNLNSIVVNSHINISDNCKFNEIDLTCAEIAGQLNLSDSIIDNNLSLESAYVGQYLNFKDVKISGHFGVANGEFGNNFILQSCEITTLDLGGVTIHGELILGVLSNPVVWQKNSFINFRNASVGSLHDGGRNCWPNDMDMDGFTYSRLGGAHGTSGSFDELDIANRDSVWFAEWLQKDKTYSPQPYLKLAEILHGMGHSEKANTILYTAKNRERDDALSQRLYIKWLGYWILNLTIGYGYGSRYFRSLVWVLLLTLCGIAVLNTVPSMRYHSLGYKTGFSFDMLLPIIQLNDEYKLTFHGWQLTYFYFHELMGFLLGSFVVAGLSGITKK